MYHVTGNHDNKNTDAIRRCFYMPYGIGIIFVVIRIDRSRLLVLIDPPYGLDTQGLLAYREV